jgi:hypothetical protein
MKIRDFELRWQFNSGIEHKREFSSYVEYGFFIDSVGLLSHPDVLKISLYYPHNNGEVEIKNNAVPMSRFDHMAKSSSMDHSVNIPAFTPETIPQIDLSDTTSNIPSYLRVV